METHHKRKQIAHDTIKRLKDDGLVSYRAVANAAEVPYQSLRTFVNTGNLGPEHTSALYDWLADRGYVATSPRAGEAPTKYGGDVLEEAIDALEFAINRAKNSTRTRPQKARLLLKEIEILHGELGPDLDKMGKGG